MTGFDGPGSPFGYRQISGQFQLELAIFSADRIAAKDARPVLPAQDCVDGDEAGERSPPLKVETNVTIMHIIRPHDLGQIVCKGLIQTGRQFGAEAAVHEIARR